MYCACIQQVAASCTAFPLTATLAVNRPQDESTKHRDVSPISGSVSDLVDTSEPQSHKKELVVSYPTTTYIRPVPTGIEIPARTASISKLVTSVQRILYRRGETFMGVDGILVLSNGQPGELVELITPSEPPAVAPEPAITQPLQPVLCSRRTP